MDLLDHIGLAARANRLANHRLHAAMAALSEAEFHAPRTSFFPSLAATLNHILAVDGYYLAGLHGEPDMVRRWSDFVAARTLAELARRQAEADARLIAFCEALDDADRLVALDRGRWVQRERAGHVLAHLAMHQTHHRGQAHSMLAGTALEPPQLDDFLLPGDAPARVADMAALGWSEAAVYGPRP
jgi:uncharacterized damage-inducible protein DinB